VGSCFAIYSWSTLSSLENHTCGTWTLERDMRANCAHRLLSFSNYVHICGDARRLRVNPMAHGNGAADEMTLIKRKDRFRRPWFQPDRRIPVFLGRKWAGCRDCRPLRSCTPGSGRSTSGLSTLCSHNQPATSNGVNIRGMGRN